MIPKYESIADDLRRSIENGDLKCGEKLPTVVELCNLYGVSKITIKRALEQLTELGFVTSRRGSGTYVKETVAQNQNLYLLAKSDRAMGFTREHIDRPVSSVVYAFDILVPPAEIADKLNMDHDDFAYYVERVRLIDDLPIVIEYTYMPLYLIPGLKKNHLYGSIYRFIREEAGLNITSFHRVVRAIAATDEEAERLQTDPGAPLLELEQTGFLDNGQPFEYSRSRNVGDRYELHNVTLA